MKDDSFFAWILLVIIAIIFAYCFYIRNNMINDCNASNCENGKPRLIESPNGLECICVGIPNK